MRQHKSRRGKDSSQPSGRLRIVAGKWRSRLLPVIDAPGLRPTPERIRETLFNWLTPNIVGSRCLDLCAGTGALGFEALSRGASQVVFVERSAPVARMLQKNIATLEAGGAEVRTGLAQDYLKAPSERCFNIAFVDPPFADDLAEDLCRLLETSGKLAPGALVYLEQERSQPMHALPDGWQLLKEKTAGNVRYSLASTEKRSQ